MLKIFCLALCCLTLNCCFGQSQADLNSSAGNDYKKADKELNTTYQKILVMYKSDTVFIKNLRKAQQLWLQLRDAEMKAKYPDRGPGYYGSVQPMCWSNYLTELTIKRTETLKVWVTGIEEGDVCSGSVRIKNQ